MKVPLPLTSLLKALSPSLPILLLSFGLFNTTALADERSNRDHSTNDYDRSHYDRSDYNRSNYGSNNRNRGYSNQQFDNRDRRPNSYRRDRDTDVSVNLIVGPGRRYYSGFNGGYDNRYRNGYNSIFNTFSYGVGYSAFGGRYNLNYGYPYTPRGYRNNSPVVIEHNTYISQPVERSGVTTYRTRQSGTSLLRDLQGRCFERVIDRNGNEIRTELDASECDF